MGSDITQQESSATRKRPAREQESKHASPKTQSRDRDELGRGVLTTTGRCGLKPLRRQATRGENSGLGVSLFGSPRCPQRDRLALIC